MYLSGETGDMNYMKVCSSIGRYLSVEVRQRTMNIAGTGP